MNVPANDRFRKRPMPTETSISKVLSKLEYGVYVVSLGGQDEGNAFTASWLSQVASEPPMIIISIHNQHQSSRLLMEKDCLVVNLLANGADNVAQAYYGPAESGYRKLDGVNTSVAPATGCPVIPGAIGYLDCKVLKRVPAGNHTVFLAEVLAAKIDPDLEIMTSRSSGLRYSG